MTREEIVRSFQYNMTNAFIEWDKAVNTEYNEDNEKAFYEGAYAAQKYLIDKMSKFFYEHIYDDAYWTCDDEFVSCRFVDDFLEKTLKE